jgi:hypothetical protein
MSEPERRLRYGGSYFSAASALPLDGGLGSPRRLAALVRAAAANPWRAFALVTLLLRSPRIDVVISANAAGDALRAHLGRRFLGIVPQHRLCQGVLILPKREEDYLRGRRRQAVRTNLRHAAAAGIVCEPIACPADALQAVAQIMGRRQAGMDAADRDALSHRYPVLFALPEVTGFVARSRDGEPLAVVVVVIDDEMCLLHVAVASNHDARWALHQHLVRTLIGRQARYLLSAPEGSFGALALAPDVQYYQHLLGYDLYHVRPRLGRRRLQLDRDVDRASAGRPRVAGRPEKLGEPSSVRQPL